MSVIRVGDRVAIRAGKYLSGYTGVVREHEHTGSDRHKFRCLVAFDNGSKAWVPTLDLKLAKMGMKKYTIPEAAILVRNKKGCGRRKTSIAIDITINEGVIRTEVLLNMLESTLRALLQTTETMEVKTGVKTEIENYPDNTI